MNKRPLVAILMGSDSDLKIMQEAAKVLEEFNVPYLIDIVSAHRTPHRAMDISSRAHEQGIKVIIAGAGLAAHLAGAIAAHTPLPVIGVPLAGGALNGTDALYSTVMMPPGVPVATVAINGAKNAGLLAVQILATSDETLMKQFIQYKKEQEQKVIEKSEKLQQTGYQKFLSS